MNEYIKATKSLELLTEGKAAQVLKKLKVSVMF